MIKVKKIAHIGIAVTNLDASVQFWRDTLGIQMTREEDVPDYQIKIIFLRTGESDIELLTPLAGISARDSFIGDRGCGLNHLCLEVDDLEQVLETLKAKGIKLIDESPVTLPGRKLAFVDPASSDGVLLEFYELTSPQSA